MYWVTRTNRFNFNSRYYRIERSETETRCRDFTTLLGARAMKACFQLPSDDAECIFFLQRIKNIQCRV